MWTFILAISCLTTSNLPWFMDLTFEIPKQYCPLQIQMLLPSQVTSTTGCCFCFGSVSSFFLELFLQSSPVAYWAPTDLGSHLSVSYIFAFSYWTGFLKQGYWSGLPFPSPVDHVFSELSTMTYPSLVALHCMAHSFIALDKAVVHVIIVNDKLHENSQMKILFIYSEHSQINISRSTNKVTSLLKYN